MILGTAQFGFDYGISNSIGELSQTMVNDVLKFSKLNSICALDTAAAYGNSEKKIGNSGLSKDFTISTKLPSLINISSSKVSNYVEDKVTNSLNNLKCETIDSLLIHSLEDLNHHRHRIWDSLIKLKEKGIIKNIGYSVYTPLELEGCYKTFKPDIIQIPYSILDKEFEKLGWLNILYTDEVRVHVRSIFLQGLLLMDITKQIKLFPKFASKWKELENFRTKNNLSALQLCLSCVKSNNKFEDYIVGFSSKAELDQILKNLNNIPDISYPDFSCSDANLIYPYNW